MHESELIIATSSSGNPLTCGCDIAWLVSNSTYLNKTYGICKNGTDIQDLNSSGYDHC